MNYQKSRAIGKAGVIYVDRIVNSQGSVFRPVHQEDDFGVDGFIELVHAETVSGKLIAVQVKTGDSYLRDSHNQFEVAVSNRHLEYWLNFVVPVILVCYSPSKDFAAWVSIRDYVENERYKDNREIKKIPVPFYRKFSEEALSQEIMSLARARADERLLIKCADNCLSSDPVTRRQGFQILCNHPDSRGLKITCFLARQFLLDGDVETAKDALFTLGYDVGRRRWSWNPTNKEEAEIIGYAAQICSDLSEAEIRRLIELIDDEHFSGPQGLGERCFDVLCCCFERADTVLSQIASDTTQPMPRRANALYMLYECSDEMMQEAAREIRNRSDWGDIVEWMIERGEIDVAP